MCSHSKLKQQQKQIMENFPFFTSRHASRILCESGVNTAQISGTPYVGSLFWGTKSAVLCGVNFNVSSRILRFDWRMPTDLAQSTLDWIGMLHSRKSVARHFTKKSFHLWLCWSVKPVWVDLQLCAVLIAEGQK